MIWLACTGSLSSSFPTAGLGIEGDKTNTQRRCPVHSSNVSSLGGGGGGGGPPSACSPILAAHAAHARSSHWGVDFATHATTLAPSFSARRSSTRLHPREQSLRVQWRASFAHASSQAFSGPRSMEPGKGGVEGAMAAAIGSQATSSKKIHTDATRIARQRHSVRGERIQRPRATRNEPHPCALGRVAM